MKLPMLCICWLSLGLVSQIEGHCLRQPSQTATRHMWQATDWAPDTASCAGPTTLRSATDSQPAVANATAIAADKAAPAVSLANYVYQCAAKRAVNPTPDFAATKKGVSNCQP